MKESNLRWITLLSRKTQVYFSSVLAPYDLTAAEQPFYMALYHAEGSTQEELTSLVYADKASTARRVKAMEEKGLLRREKDPEDRRRNRLYLTDRAKACFDDVHRDLLALDRRLVEGLSDEEQEVLSRALRLMQKNMNRALAEQRREEGEDHG